MPKTQKKELGKAKHRSEEIKEVLEKENWKVEKLVKNGKKTK